MIRCLVIDDEPLAREGIAEYINQIGYLKLVGLAEDPIQALNIINSEEVDLLFVDIQTPKMTGLEFVESLSHPPMVVITTAYPTYALQGYELNVLDYLVKPISFKRFLQATEKAKEMSQFQKYNQVKHEYEPHLFVKVNGGYQKLIFAEILFIKSMQNYIQIHTEKDTYLILESLKGILEKLNNNFIQVHKSYIVNSQKIDSLEGNTININNFEIPVSRTLKQSIIDMITSSNQ